MHIREFERVTMTKLSILLSALILLTSCRESPSSQTSTTSSAKPTQTIFFTQHTPHFADTFIFGSESAEFINKLKIKWPKNVIFPKYSKTLSNLAGFLGKYKGQPLEPLSLVTLSAQWGITTPWIIQTYLEVKKNSEAEFLKWAKSNLINYIETHQVSHFGFKTFKTEEGRLLVFLMQKRQVLFAPFQKWLKKNEPLVLFGQLDKNISSAELLVTKPDGKIEQRGLNIFANNTFKVGIKFCNEKKDQGKYHFELMGSGEYGPTVLAHFPVACGKKNWPKFPEAKFLVEKEPVTSVEFEKELFERINRYRVNIGLKPIELNSSLIKVARSHSSEMCFRKILMHISPSTGNPQERLEAAKVKNIDLLAENIATGRSISETFNGWVSSEGHRINLQLANITHGGIGVCRKDLEKGDYTYYITLILTSYKDPKD
jgi:uncharacterized protein YkwD